MFSLNDEKTMLVYTPYFFRGTLEELRQSIEWEQRDVEIKDSKGKVIYAQSNVETPKFWSQNAVTIAASKYFRGHDDGREDSIWRLCLRVAGGIAYKGYKNSYYDEVSEAAVEVDLMYVLLHQYAAFNSPVWFNVGTKPDPQCSACFLIGVEDNMESILNWYKEEGMVFKGGSGAGINISKLREKNAKLSIGGYASGPLSFALTADRSAGAIKSGGTTRRAAKLLCMDADHPDIYDFIQTKVEGEKIAKALINQGFSAEFNVEGGAYELAPWQNANNSVRVSDSFMHAVEQDADWDLLGRKSKNSVQRVKARDLFRKMAEAAWECGDPGVMYDTIINDWHTCPHVDRIYTSNPCQPASACVLTPGGVKTFAEIDVGSIIWSGKQWTKVKRKIATGIKEVKQYFTPVGWFEGTANHKVLQFGERIEVQNATHIDIAHAPEGMLPALSNRQKDFAQAQAPITSVVSLGERPVWDIEVEAEEHTYWTGGLLVSNCAEYNFLNDTACNLASINLLKTFQGEPLCALVNLLAVLMEVIVEMSGYPTEKITVEAKKYRTLGLGFANLGALLMQLGMPYDSKEGRRVASEIMSCITAYTYGASHEVATFKGSFTNFDAGNFRRVLMKHRNASFTADLASTQVWDLLLETYDSCPQMRNAQATVLAPTGTIALLLDCDTTGVEPDLALVKYKKLVGGGNMKFVNQTVSGALTNRGYPQDQVEAIVKFIADNDTIEGAPFLKDEHLPIFDCSLQPANGKRYIEAMGHVRMLGALQPFISGAASKTINMPNTATVEDIEQIYMDAWKMGIKAIAIYRDGCKQSQPLNTKAEKSPSIKPEDLANALQDRIHIETTQARAAVPVRRSMPKTRTAVTHKFTIANNEGYLNVGLFEDGKPGELFITMSKQGSTLSGLMDAFATSVSMGLQYGVPLAKIIEKFKYTKFEPAGFTGDEDVPQASSILDYIFKWLEIKFLMGTTPEHISVTPIIMPSNNSGAKGDSPLCASCGASTTRSGACYRCLNCGNTTGCG